MGFKGILPTKTCAIDEMRWCQLVVSLHLDPYRKNRKMCTKPSFVLSESIGSIFF